MYVVPATAVVSIQLSVLATVATNPKLPAPAFRSMSYTTLQSVAALLQFRLTCVPASATAVPLVGVGAVGAINWYF